MDKQSKGPTEKQKNREIQRQAEWKSKFIMDFLNLLSISIFFKHELNFFIGDWNYQRFITVKEQNNTFEVELIQFPFFWNLEVIQIRIKKVTTI